MQLQRHHVNLVEEVLNEQLEIARRHYQNGQTDIAALVITYGALCARVRFGTPMGMGPYLDEVGRRERRHERTGLDCLVVNARSRLPGLGWRGSERNWREDWEREVKTLCGSGR